MRTNSWGIALFAVITLTSIPAQAGEANRAPLGNWLFEDGESAVELYRCGPALCGRFSWFKADRTHDGKPLIDSKNPNAALRTRALCGMEFITGLKPTPKGTWEGGKIYTPGGGATYDLDFTKVEPNHIVERGYRGIRMFGQTFHLNRAPADLPRCQNG